MSAFISVLCVIVVVYLPLLILQENDEIVNKGVGGGGKFFLRVLSQIFNCVIAS